MFKRLFRRKDDNNEPPATRADLGLKSDFYYDEEKKRWRQRGQEGEEEDEAPPPPPPKMAAPAPAANGGGPPPPSGGANPYKRPVGARSRYVDTLNPNANTGPEAAPAEAAADSAAAPAPFANAAPSSAFGKVVDPSAAGDGGGGRMRPGGAARERPKRAGRMQPGAVKVAENPFGAPTMKKQEPLPEPSNGDADPEEVNGDAKEAKEATEAKEAKGELNGDHGTPPAPRSPLPPGPPPAPSTPPPELDVSNGAPRSGLSEADIVPPQDGHAALLHALYEPPERTTLDRKSTQALQKAFEGDLDPAELAPMREEGELEETPAPAPSRPRAPSGPVIGEAEAVAAVRAQMEKQMAELQSRVDQLEAEKTQLAAQGEERVAEQVAAAEARATAAAESTRGELEAQLLAALQAKQRAEDRAEAEAARVQEITALYVEATDALALEKAKASTTTMAIPDMVWDKGPEMVDLVSRLMTENARLRRPGPPAESPLEDALQILASCDELDKVLATWAKAGDDRSATLAGCEAVARLSFTPKNRTPAALEPCVAALSPAQPNAAAAAMSAIWNLTFERTVLDHVELALVDKVVAFLPADGMSEQDMMPDLVLAALAVLTNLAIRGDLRARIPAAKVVATVGSDPAAADVELLEQALMTLFLLATNDGLKPDVEAGTRSLLAVARSHADEGVRAWGQKLEAVLGM